MKSNPVGWFEIYVKDMNRMVKFYEAIFMTTLQKLNNPELDLRAFPMAKGETGASGALVHMPDFPLKGNNTVIYFTCEDCAAELSRVPSNGGTIQKEKFSIGEYGFIALAMDPEHNMFGLHSTK